jgi:ABA responsive element binding factor
MNMDEFFVNLWNSDDNQVPSQPNQNVRPDNDHGGVTKQCPNLARQGSFSIPAPLCKKTVDEVLFEIQNDEPQQHNPNSIGADHEPPQRQQTLGEITLEDFLIKAGVVQEAPAGSSQQKKVTPIQDRNINACLDMNFGMGHMMGLGYQNLSAGNGFAAYQMFPQGKLGYNVGEVVPNNAKNEKCQSIMDLGAQSSKKRMNDGPPEVVVERRQRRMIKNRESAARSRARKQVFVFS